MYLPSSDNRNMMAYNYDLESLRGGGYGIVADWHDG